MIDKDGAIERAAKHLSVVDSSSTDVLHLDFATHSTAKPSAFSPGPSDRNGWKVHFNYLDGMEGHHIICVGAETGEVYFTFSM